MAEPMLYLTKDGSVKPRVHIEAATKKLFICGLDFVREASVRPLMPPDEGESYIFEAIKASRCERWLINNRLVIFPGRYESQSPRLCFSVKGIYLIYNYMEKIGLVNKEYQAEVESVMKDVDEEIRNLKYFLKMHDDGEKAEQEVDSEFGRFTSPPVGSKFNADSIPTAADLRIEQAQAELVEILTNKVEVRSLIIER